MNCSFARAEPLAANQKSEAQHKKRRACHFPKMLRANRSCRSLQHCQPWNPSPGATNVCTRGRAHLEFGASCGIAVDLRSTPHNWVSWKKLGHLHRELQNKASGLLVPMLAGPLLGFLLTHREDGYCNPLQARPVECHLLRDRGSRTDGTEDGRPVM